MIPWTLYVSPRYISCFGGTRWRTWLRHCATSRKVAGSIPNCVIGILQWHNPSGRTMALGLTRPLTVIAGSCRQPQTYVKPESAITVFELLMMSGVSLETCWAIKKHWNNKFYHTVAYCWLFLYHFHVWTHCGRVTQMCVFNTVKLGTSASSP